jgi:hypothetical protein
MMMACDWIEALRVEKRADNTTDPKAPTTIFTPFLQNPSFGNYMALCAARKPAALADAVREVARRMGNDLSIREVRSMEDVVTVAVATERFLLQRLRWR